MLADLTSPTGDPTVSPEVRSLRRAATTPALVPSGGGLRAPVPVAPLADDSAERPDAHRRLKNWLIF